MYARLIFSVLLHRSHSIILYSILFSFFLFSSVLFYSTLILFSRSRLEWYLLFYCTVVLFLLYSTVSSILNFYSRLLFSAALWSLYSIQLRLYFILLLFSPSRLDCYVLHSILQRVSGLWSMSLFY